MKGSIMKERSMERELMYGLMAACIWEIGQIIRLKGLESIPGLMEDLMKVLGKITICMVKESMLGKMEEGMKVSMNMIKNVAMEFTPGLMVGNTRVIG